jgi:hypothetical protein
LRVYILLDTRKREYLMTKIEVSKAVRDAFPELRISYFTATQLRSQLRGANAEKLLDAAIADIGGCQGSCRLK